jgi:hypothetical protein
MKISKSITLRITSEVFNLIQDLAEKDNRSFANYVSHVLTHHTNMGFQLENVAIEEENNTIDLV